MIHAKIGTILRKVLSLLTVNKRNIDMRTDFPQVDLPVDIIAWSEVTEEILNIYKQACRLKACIFALCREGTITVSINLMETEVKQGDFIILLPGSIIQFYGQKEKFKLSFVGFSSHCLTGVNLIQSAPSSFTTILEYPVLNLNDTLSSYVKDYFALLDRVTTGPYPPDTRMAQQILTNLLYVVEKLYGTCPKTEKRPQNRKEEIYRKFIQLVIENYMHERHAQFYANCMGISLQHLSTTVKQVTGKNVLDIIANVVLIDAKAKLKSTDMTVQEIAYSLNFPSASFFGKYFKRYMGIKPLDYRHA